MASNNYVWNTLHIYHLPDQQPTAGAHNGVKGIIMLSCLWHRLTETGVTP